MAGVEDDLTSLGRRGRAGSEPLAPAPAPQARPAQQGRGYPAPAGEQGGSGGLVSPVVEDPAGRAYHPEQAITSSDGLFVLTFNPYAGRRFVDAVGNTEERQYAL